MSEEISQYLQERIDAGDFPSAVYLVAERGEIVLHGAVGDAVVEPERIAARVDTIYDLASLTKVLVTGLIAAKRIDEGEMAPEDTVAKFLPSFGETDKVSITIEQLATHTSGLPAWIPLYLKTSTPQGVPGVIAAEPLATVPGSSVVYSDLNFILLARIIEQIDGFPIDRTACDEIFDKLGLRRTTYLPLKRSCVRGIDRTDIAASEKGNRFERNTCVEQGYLNVDSVDAAAAGDMFRDDVIWGEVHDNNAYFMGGVSGHAGLFSTAEEIFRIAQQYLPEYTSLLTPKVCGLFRRNLTPELSEHRSFAFQLASTPDSAAGTRMSPESFGHLGFTGTSLWIDPVHARVFVLLTNRTHHHDLPFVIINAVRRRFHDLAIEHLDRNS